MNKKIKSLVFASVLFLIPIVAGATWSDPAGSPPNNNTSIPLNVGSASQTKTGGLSVGSLISNGGVDVNGNLSVTGSLNASNNISLMGGMSIVGSGGSPNAGYLTILNGMNAQGVVKDYSFTFANNGDLKFVLGKHNNIVSEIFKVVEGDKRLQVSSGINVYGPANFNNDTALLGENNWIKNSFVFYDQDQPSGTIVNGLWMDSKSEYDGSGILLKTYVGNNKENLNGGPIWLNPWGDVYNNPDEPNGQAKVVIGNFSGTPEYPLEVAGTIRTTGSILANEGIQSKRGLLLVDTFSSSAGHQLFSVSLFPTYSAILSNRNIIITPGGAQARLGVGTTAPTQKLHVGGNVRVDGVVTQNSDISLKKNIKPISNALSKILNVKGVTFDWKENGEKAIGVIAQDIEKVFPEVVATDDKGIKSVSYANLVAPLIEAIKEQQAQIEELKAEIELLKSR